MVIKSIVSSGKKHALFYHCETDFGELFWGGDVGDCYRRGVAGEGGLMAMVIGTIGANIESL